MDIEQTGYFIGADFAAPTTHASPWLIDPYADVAAVIRRDLSNAMHTEKPSPLRVEHTKPATLYADFTRFGASWDVPRGVSVLSSTETFGGWKYSLMINWLNADCDALQALPTGMWLLDENGEFLSGDRDAYEYNAGKPNRARASCLPAAMGEVSDQQRAAIAEMQTRAQEALADDLWLPNVRHSDRPGIEAAAAHADAVAAFNPPPVQPSRVKPSISGLGVTASGDHRLGRFGVSAE